MYLDNGSKRDGDALRKLLGVGHLVHSEAQKPRRSVSVINHPVLRRGLYIGIYDDMYHYILVYIGIYRYIWRGEALPSSITRYCDEAYISVCMAIYIMYRCIRGLYIGIYSDIYRYLGHRGVGALIKERARSEFANRA